MTRPQLLGVAAAAAVLIAGALLWRRWGAMVWLDSAIAYCF